MKEGGLYIKRGSKSIHMMLIMLEKKTMPSAHYSQEYWNPVWSHTLCWHIFSNMFLIPVNAPAHACAAHVSYFSQLFFYSSFNSFFWGVSLFGLHIQTGDACFLLRVCDTPLNPCYFSADCEPRWSFASSERSFYGCQTREFLAHAGLQSHQSVILGFYHMCLSRCQSFVFAIPFF